MLVHWEDSSHLSPSNPTHSGLSPSGVYLCTIISKTQPFEILFHGLNISISKSLFSNVTGNITGKGNILILNILMIKLILSK